MTLSHPDGSLRKTTKSSDAHEFLRKRCHKQAKPTILTASNSISCYFNGPYSDGESSRFLNIWRVVAEMRSHCYKHIMKKRLHPSILDF